MAVVPMIWALLVVAGLDAATSWLPFLFAEVLAVGAHIVELRQRFRRLRNHEHWW